MSDLLNAVDKLNHAKHLFAAVEMAFADIRDRREQGALGAVLSDALDCLEEGIAGVENVRHALRQSHTLATGGEADAAPISPLAGER